MLTHHPNISHTLLGPKLHNYFSVYIILMFILLKAAVKNNEVKVIKSYKKTSVENVDNIRSASAGQCSGGAG